MQNAMQRSLKYVLVGMLTLVGSYAWSDCACFCVEGALTTMCTDAGEAQNSPNLCPADAGGSCPQQFSTEGAANYEAPNDSAVNCRDVKVYDAIRGEYVTAKACNVI